MVKQALTIHIGSRHRVDENEFVIGADFDNFEVVGRFPLFLEIFGRETNLVELLLLGRFLLSGALLVAFMLMEEVAINHWHQCQKT
jgi:hypothetical protein